MKFLDRRFVVRTVVSFVAMAAMFARAPAAPPATTPDNEIPATTNFREVDRFGPVAALLNLAQGTVRIVAVVPVDSASSTAVVDTIAAVVAANPSKRLRAYVILCGGESSMRALVLAARHPNPRVAYFWDPTGAVARAWDSGRTTVGTAWLYDTSATFSSDRPPASALTVTARTGRKGTVLNGGALRAESDELVRRVEAKLADQQ